MPMMEHKQQFPYTESFVASKLKMLIALQLFQIAILDTMKKNFEKILEIEQLGIILPHKHLLLAICKTQVETNLLLWVLQSSKQNLLQQIAHQTCKFHLIHPAM